MDYRRIYLPGGTYFFTLVTYQRQPIFASPQSVELLRQAFRYAMNRKPFTIVASVVLPDHIHSIWTMPATDADYSTCWRMIKGHFTRHWWDPQKHTQNASRRRRGERDVWQRRFWEHLIRDEKDLRNHIEYIHFNPVKHGLVHAPVDWQYSSFSKYVREDLYPEDWGVEANVWGGNQSME